MSQSLGNSASQKSDLVFGISKGSSGKTLLITGFVLLFFPIAYKNRVRYYPSEKQPTQIQQVVQKEQIVFVDSQNNPIKIDPKLINLKDVPQTPNKIIIPTLSLDLPIVEAKVVNGFWELSENSASHGIGSANPGERGNIVIFAHARDELFGPLRKIKKDNQIYVLSKEKWFKYKVIETKEVDPKDIEVIAPTEFETLTLYTCSGFLDGKRLIIKALPSA